MAGYFPDSPRIFIRVQGSPVDIRTATPWNLDRLQHTLSVACVIAQQYSSLNIRHPQHTQTSSSTSTIAAGVWQMQDAIDTVVCTPDDGWRYHPKHLEQFPDKINCVTLHLVGYTRILEFFYYIVTNLFISPIISCELIYKFFYKTYQL